MNNRISGYEPAIVSRNALFIAAGLLTCLLSSPAVALKYAAKEHDLDADPTIPAWVPGKLDIAGKQEFNIVGSDTMDEITLEWVKMFRKAYPELSVTMEARASGTGAQGLIEGRSHIGTVARELLPREEKAFMEKFGYPATGFRVATGSVGSLGKTASTVIFVDRDNPIPGLTMPQLDAIYSTSRNRGYHEVRTWGDLGLTGQWADIPIHLYGLEAPNGIEQYFQEAVLLGGEYKHDIEFVHTAGHTHAFTAAAERMADHPGGLTYAMLANLRPNVRVVPLADDDGAPFLMPTVENVYRHAYPLSRYIYIFVNQAPGEALAPEITEFLRLVLSYQGQSAVAREGVFIPLQPEVVKAELQRLK